MLFPPVPHMDEAHVYTFQGVRYPNVTSILGAVGIVNYSAMPPALKEAAMKRGSFVHKACELDDLGTLDESTLAEELRGYVEAWRAFRRFLTREGGEIIPEWTERKMVSIALGYCGTMDRVVRQNGVDISLDIKTGKLMRWTGVQLAAYDLARGECNRERWGVQLGKDGDFKRVIYTDNDDYATWLAALKVYKFSNKGE